MCHSEGANIENKYLWNCRGSWGGWISVDIPLPKVTCIFGSTLLKLMVAPWGCCPKLTVCFLHFPSLSYSGSQMFCKGTDHDWFCALCTSQVQKAGATRWWAKYCLIWIIHRMHLSGPRHSVCLCVRGNCHRCAVCLLRAIDLRQWSSCLMWIAQELRNSWLVTVSLLRAWWEMSSLGPDTNASSHLRLAVNTLLSASKEERSINGSWLGHLRYFLVWNFFPPLGAF